MRSWIRLPSKITQGQEKLISAISRESKKGEALVSSFLKKIFKHSISDLTMQEASRLIESLKDQESAAGSRNPPPATAKQISLLKRLQDGAERMEKLNSMLRKIGKESISELTVPEASAIIDSLILTKAGSSEERGRSPATEKQVRFLEKLYAKENSKKTIDTFLVKHRKKSLEELTRSEAGELLDGLVDSPR